MLASIFKKILFLTSLLLSTAAYAESGCTGAVDSLTVTEQEREKLLEQLRISTTGQKLIQSFIERYGSIDSLHISWSTVSYSKYPQNPQVGAGERRPASLSSEVCIYLTRQLPPIEHLADLAHELTHATRLPHAVLLGEGVDEKEFVRKRIAEEGGEADAFAVECRVKRETIGHWDKLCAPYASLESDISIDSQRVVHDLYNGLLAASLTGETYPQLLARQFRASRPQK